MEQKILNAAIDRVYKSKDRKSLKDLQKLIRYLR